MEKLYQYLWKNRMLGRDEFTLVDGRRVHVLDFGRLNTDSGPDFFNAKIKELSRPAGAGAAGNESTVWAGNVELHVNASDWFRHGHHTDPAYDGVILHVVACDDARVCRRSGAVIPQLIITLPDGFMTLYSAMTVPEADIRCRPHLDSISRLYRDDWLESLAVERIQAKSERIIRILETTGNDWEQAAFVTLARALGFGLNSEPFEMLARSLPLRVIHKHSDDLQAIEALLFGQAGMLDPYLYPDDPAYQRLCREYGFLNVKYGLTPVSTIWKGSRMRPQNSPQRRIKYLAKMCLGGFSLLRRIIDNSGDLESMRRLFTTADMTPASSDLLIINCAAPLLLAYSRMRGDERLEDAAIAMLAALPAERNAITKSWESVGIRADNAWRSQALIQLRKEYCDAGKCLYCRFGYRHLKSAMAEEAL